MKPFFSFIIAVLFSLVGLAQRDSLFSVNADSTAFRLTLRGATHLAGLPMKCIHQEYPNKTGHTSVQVADHVKTPSQLHPAFYGCFDWHSSVHGHWMLIRLLKLYPDMPDASRIRQALHNSFKKQNIIDEVKYFDLPMTASWERTYGWAWILKLAEELDNWNDADGKQWRNAMQPLTKKIVELWLKYLPKQTYPNRTGVHPNTAFGMVFGLDYARAAKDTVLELAIANSARQLFVNDRDAPARWEPNGSDFLSPSLEEADLMRRILPKQEFVKWFDSFLNPAALMHLTILPVVSDRADLQIVHLDGLSFSRSWCMKGIAAALPENDPRKSILTKAAITHLSHALPHVVSGEYGGEHWLASFAVYALLN